jgi:hypothetical protein
MITLRAACASLALSAPLLSGCSLFYEHHLEYDEFSLYGDQSRATLERTGDTIERVFAAYRELFPSLSKRVHGARVLYAEDSLSQERIFTGELRQEGFYLPAFDLIHLSPRRPRGDADDLSVILHEMAHHFLISGYPSTSSRYWLNEGLACCLEVSFFDDDGRLRTPYFHSTLYGQARRLLREEGEEAFRRELDQLLEASWFRFHHSDDKNRNYALSWGLFWQILEEREGSLDERVREIVALDAAEVRAAVDALIVSLEEGADRHLARLAEDPALRGWCLDRWAELPFADGRRFLGLLQDEIGSEPSPRSWARAARLANGQVRGLERSERRALHEQVATALARDENGEVRLAIAEALAEEGSTVWAYITPLIDGLEDPDWRIRAASARALARLSRQKPTVVNPGFWRDAHESERAAEVEEWRRWMHRYRG